MIKNIFKVLPILLIAFALFTSDAKAGAPVSLNGYAWSDNIGWLSFNGSDGGNVTFATSTVSAGVISGYAWSDNIGWVSFQNGDISHPNPTVDLSTGVVNGWARACAGTVNGDCVSADRIDGWDGWIELSGTNHTSPVFNGTGGVTVSSSTGKFNGYAWGSDVIGWISFDSGVGVTFNPIVVVNNTLTGACTADKTSLPVGGGSVTYLFTPTNGTAPYSSNLWGTLSKTYNNISSSQTAFNITVTDSSIPSKNGSFSCPAVTVAPPVIIGGGTGNMWVDNNTTLTTTKITTGRKAKINWSVPLGYTCSGADVSGAVVPGWHSISTTSDQPSGTPYLTPTLSSTGIYNIGMTCTKSGKPNVQIGPVKIIVSDSSIIEI